MKNYSHLQIIQNEVENVILSHISNGVIDHSDGVAIADAVSNTMRRMLLTKYAYKDGLDVKTGKQVIGGDNNADSEKE